MQLVCEKFQVVCNIKRWKHRNSVEKISLSLRTHTLAWTIFETEVKAKLKGKTMADALDQVADLINSFVNKPGYKNLEDKDKKNVKTLVGEVDSTLVNLQKIHPFKQVEKLSTYVDEYLKLINKIPYTKMPKTDVNRPPNYSAPGSKEKKAKNSLVKINNNIQQKGLRWKELSALGTATSEVIDYIENRKQSPSQEEIASVIAQALIKLLEAFTNLQPYWGEVLSELVDRVGRNFCNDHNELVKLSNLIESKMPEFIKEQYEKMETDDEGSEVQEEEEMKD